MKDLRKILYILAGQLKASAVSIRVWLGYAIGHHGCPEKCLCVLWICR